MSDNHRSSGARLAGLAYAAINAARATTTQTHSTARRDKFPSLLHPHMGTRTATAQTRWRTLERRYCSLRFLKASRRPVRLMVPGSSLEVHLSTL